MYLEPLRFRFLWPTIRLPLEALFLTLWVLEFIYIWAIWNDSPRSLLKSADKSPFLCTTHKCVCLWWPIILPFGRWCKQMFGMTKIQNDKYSEWHIFGTMSMCLQSSHIHWQTAWDPYWSQLTKALFMYNSQMCLPLVANHPSLWEGV